MKFLEEKKFDKSWDAQPEGSSDVDAEALDDQGTINSDQQNRFFTPERLYTLGSRLVPFLFLVILLFIAALYYGFINP